MSEIAVREFAPELDKLARLGQWLAMSESGSQDPAARGASAALRLYYAQELGLPPLAAAELSVIKGKLSMSAQLLRGLARQRGFRIERGEFSDQRCSAKIVEVATGEVLGEDEFTIQDARTAGLVRQGSAWTTHPKRMLWARVSKNLIVDYAPDVALGIILDDEVPEVVGVWSDDSAVEAPSRVASPREASGPADDTGPATADTPSVGEPQAPGGVSEPDAIEASSPTEVPVYARAFLLAEPDRLSETLDWDMDAATLVARIKESDWDLRTLRVMADMEARRLQKSGKAGARQTVLHALHKRMVALGWRSPELGGGGPEAAEEGVNPSPPPAAEPPLPEALQPAPPLDRFLALFAGDSALPDWLTVAAVLGESGRIDNATYGGLMDVPDETLAQVWALVPEDVRSLVEGMTADSFQEELIV